MGSHLNGSAKSPGWLLLILNWPGIFIFLPQTLRVKRFGLEPSWSCPIAGLAPSRIFAEINCYAPANMANSAGERPFVMQPCKRLSALLTGLMLLFTISCSNNQSTSNSAQQQGKTDQQSPNKSNIDTDQSPKTVSGNAAWYGPGFYGQKTTSGEVLKEGTMTAAHSSLPMGTEVKVTRLDTNESVTVVINDRKPYKEGTVIDLAHGAADALDIDDDGTADVEIEILD